MAETVATTAGGMVLEVVTGGRDYQEKRKKQNIVSESLKVKFETWVFK